MQLDSEREYLMGLLSASTKKGTDSLQKAADSARKKFVGNKVYFRGIVEFSNICEKDCFYCGIRKGNANVERYRMDEDEIVKCARWAFSKRYGSLVLQSGESTRRGSIDFVVKAVERIKKETSRMDPKGKGLGITLSVGEQKKKTYEEFFGSGAHRYLLRIETSNPGLYRKLHPPGHSFGNRVRCLRDLKEIGFQVGTGVMIGLPGQTAGDLADDLLFFREMDADMIGMGPYIPHKDTPLYTHSRGWEKRKKKQLRLSLNMVAAARLLLRDVNIASTTALQVLHPFGRELALRHGANVIMPIITPARLKRHYFLYDGKPCVDEDPEACMECLTQRITGTGREVGWGEYGDSPHYSRRIK